MLKISLFCWNDGHKFIDQPLHFVRLAGQDAQRLHARATQRGLDHEVALQIGQLSALQDFKLLCPESLTNRPSIDLLLARHVEQCGRRGRFGEHEPEHAGRGAARQRAHATAPASSDGAGN